MNRESLAGGYYSLGPFRFLAYKEVITYLSFGKTQEVFEYAARNGSIELIKGLKNYKHDTLSAYNFLANLLKEAAEYWRLDSVNFLFSLAKKHKVYLDNEDLFPFLNPAKKLRAYTRKGPAAAIYLSFFENEVENGEENIDWGNLAREAAESGVSELLALLISRFPSSINLEACLSEAASENRIGILKMLLKKDPNIPKDGALMYASDNEALESFLFLLSLYKETEVEENYIFLLALILKAGNLKMLILLERQRPISEADLSEAIKYDPSILISPQISKYVRALNVKIPYIFRYKEEDGSRFYRCLRAKDLLMRI